MTALDADYTRVLFGQHAVHVPAWLVVQDQGDGLVSFVGASRGAGPHPLRFGSTEVHQLVVGEIIVRPHHVTHSSARAGSGLAGLVTDPYTDLADAERII
jgi:hypothetical protein